jgi:hypothetical protein
MSIVFAIFVYPFYQPSSPLHCLLRVVVNFKMSFHGPQLVYLVKSHSRPRPGLSVPLAVSTLSTSSLPFFSTHSISPPAMVPVYSASSSLFIVPASYITDSQSRFPRSAPSRPLHFKPPCPSSSPSSSPPRISTSTSAASFPVVKRYFHSRPLKKSLLHLQSPCPLHLIILYRPSVSFAMCTFFSSTN